MEWLKGDSRVTAARAERAAVVMVEVEEGLEREESPLWWALRRLDCRAEEVA